MRVCACVERLTLELKGEHQIGEALSVQAVRMEQAVVNERNRKAAAAAEANRKRSITALSDEASEAKKKVEQISHLTIHSLFHILYTSIQ